ncbi:50S ribosomal protein L11 [Patescibacteria group bacterium]|nr:50S ribosomal protein L11 [Patescibacteria group bacterium]
MKKIKAKIKLRIPAGQATPAPPVGPALAPHGLNIAEFCQKFNEKTKDQKGFTIPVEITIFGDKSYEFRLKTSPASELLKKAAGLEKGSGTPNKIKVGKVSRVQLREIAKKKMEDLNTQDLEKAMKIIEGTAKNMGIEIE